MEAKFYKMGEVVVIKISGRINADENKPFRDLCELKLKNEKVIFCLEQLHFTASANISTFFDKVLRLLIVFFKILNLSIFGLKKGMWATIFIICYLKTIFKKNHIDLLFVQYKSLILYL